MKLSFINRYLAQFRCFDRSRKVVKTCKLSVLLRRVPVDETEFHIHIVTNIKKYQEKLSKHVNCQKMYCLLLLSSTFHTNLSDDANQH